MQQALQLLTQGQGRDRKSYPDVRARMPAFGLVGIRMVIIGIRLQTWMRVIVDVDE